MSEETFVGIDVCKERLEVTLCAQGTGFSLPHSQEGLKELLARLRDLSWGRRDARPLPVWLRWRPSSGRAAAAESGGASGAAGPGRGRPSTWPPWWP